MKVVNQFIVFDGFNTLQMLFECDNDQWYITSNGGFGQREMYIELITEDKAKLLIKNTP